MMVLRIFTGNSLDKVSVMALVWLDVIRTFEFDSLNITESDLCKTDDESKVT